VKWLYVHTPFDNWCVKKIFFFVSLLKNKSGLKLAIFYKKYLYIYNIFEKTELKITLLVKKKNKTKTNFLD